MLLSPPDTEWGVTEIGGSSGILTQDLWQDPSSTTPEIDKQTDTQRSSKHTEVLL